MKAHDQQGIVTLLLRGGQVLHLMLDRHAQFDALPPDSQVVLAIESTVTDYRQLGFDADARAALGDRVWVTFFDAGDASQRSEDLLLTAYLVSGLLDRGRPVVLFATAAAFLELLAAAVLLVRGHSQPGAIAEVQKVRPDAFPEIDDEIALAAIDDAHRARAARAARTA